MTSAGLDVQADDNAGVGWWLLLAYGLLWLVAAVTLGVRSASPDWQTFYAVGRAVLDGTPWYAASAPPNLTPPLMAPVFAGLALLPIGAAFVVWTAAGLTGTFWMTRRVARAWGRPMWQVAALLLVIHGMPIGVLLGQLHLIVFVLVTAAWLADRDDRPLAAGAWLGAAIYLKPFFVLVVLYWVWRRGWRAAGTAAGIAGAGYAAGWLWLPAATTGWLDAIRLVTWQDSSVNLAIWGFIARLELPLWIAIGVSALILLLLLWRLPALSRDGAWFAVLAAACLVSPVAWIYYALALLGPIGLVYQQGDGPTRRLLEAGYLGLCVPLAFQIPAVEAAGLRAATLGSWYFWAFVCWWLAALRPGSTTRPPEHPARVIT